MASAALIISVLSIAVSVVGWFVVDRQSKRRAQDERRRSFINFLLGWREEICSAAKVGLQAAIDAYLRRAFNYCSELNNAKDLYAKRGEQFAALTDKLRRLKDEQEWQKPGANEMLLRELDALIRFVQAK